MKYEILFLKGYWKSVMSFLHLECSKLIFVDEILTKKFFFYYDKKKEQRIRKEIGNNTVYFLSFISFFAEAHWIRITNESFDVLFQNSIVDAVENASVCSWEAVEERSGASSASMPSQSASSVLWVPDHAVTKCTGCDMGFWLGRRKHHCRWVFVYQYFSLSWKKF